MAEGGPRDNQSQESPRVLRGSYRNPTGSPRAKAFLSETKPQETTQLPRSMVMHTPEKTSSVHSVASMGGHGDRFIPSIPGHGSTVARQLFGLPETAFVQPGDVSAKSEKEQNDLIFASILERELLLLEERPLSEADDAGNEGGWRVFSAGKGAKTPNRRGSVYLSDRKPDRASGTSKGLGEGLPPSKRPKLLHFSEKKHPRGQDTGLDSDHHLFSSGRKDENPVIKNIRHMRRIAKTPVKVLDAPGLVDDFYQNLLDWSSDDVISIALGSVVYFWSCRNQQNVVVKAAEKRDEDFYCSVKWNPSGSLIGLGSDYGCLQVMESSTCSSVWTYSCHEAKFDNKSLVCLDSNF